MNTYEQKIEAKKERYLELAQRNKQESESRLNTAHKMADIIPFGQPILVCDNDGGVSKFNGCQKLLDSLIEYIADDIITAMPEYDQADVWGSERVVNHE